MVKNSHIVLLSLFLLGALLISGCNGTPRAAQVKDGATVQVNYTGKLADGTVFDSSVGLDPLQFTLGTGDIIPGFEKAVLGMKIGEKKTVTIPANEAYGPRREDLMLEIPRGEIPTGITPRDGQQLQLQLNDGSTIIVTVTKVADTTITIDANHPLAGKDLTFEIELLKIQ